TNQQDPICHPSPNLLLIFLWWTFEGVITNTDVHFIHVHNAQGEQVGQLDQAVGVYSAGTQRVERLDVSLLDNLPAGEYRIYAGWYTYPDLTRFPILSGGADERAQDGLAYIGSLT